MKITKKMLEEKDACNQQVKLFEEVFGDSVDLTKVSIEDAIKFDINWAANNFLEATALEEYKKIQAPTLEEYKKIQATAFIKLYIEQGEMNDV